MILPLPAVILIGAVMYCVAVFLANRSRSPYVGPILSIETPANLPVATETLTVLTWNIGYGALGKDADVIVDGGQSLRALSAKNITLATQRVAGRLAGQAADVICLQENANAGFLTRGVGVRAMIDAALFDRQNFFWADMKSVLVPRPLRLEHGMSVHAKVRVKACTSILFPKDSTYFFAGLTKHYGGLVSRISIGDTGRDWVVFNIHLSAFDPDIDARMGQIEDLLRHAQHAYDQGHFVVIAGDWNMRLGRADGAVQTNPNESSPIFDFPQACLPKGWTIGVDGRTPTVRSLSSSYLVGQTHTATIDGFVCSPNVAVTRVSTADLGFEDTDHHPVEACFKTMV